MEILNINIPSEILLYIFQFLNETQQIKLCQVCYTFNNIIRRYITKNKRLYMRDLIQSDNIKLLQWMLDNCHNTLMICVYMSKNGYIRCLKYAHKNGCGWHAMFNNDILKLYNSCTWSAMNGHLECLKYCHENGCTWNEWTCDEAIKGNHLECLKYCLENGCKYSNICSTAAYYGSLDSLKYAHENGYSWNELTCDQAIKGNHPECLKYCLENNCEYGDICLIAAYYGSLDCLKYAHENGYSSRKNIIEIAAQYGHLKCFEYAKQIINNK